LIHLLKNTSPNKIEEFLAELQKQYSPTNSDSASFQNLLNWWRDLDRQRRLSNVSETLVAMIKAASSLDPCESLLTQIYGTLTKSKPPLLDELINELDRRLDPYDNSSAVSACEWWRNYRCRARRDDCISLVNEAVKQVPAEVGRSAFPQITNSLPTFSCEEVDPILHEIEARVTTKDGSTLREVLAWFEKKYLRPPAWSVVIAISEGAADIKQANDLAVLLVKQLQTRAIGARIAFSEKIVSFEEESQATSICRDLDAKAVLLLKLLLPDPPRRDANSALGRIAIAEVTIQALPICPGIPVKPLVFPGKCIDPRNNPEKFVIQKAFENAAMTASEDVELASTLGLQLFLPKR
jgi:hypothetical protein